MIQPFAYPGYARTRTDANQGGLEALRLMTHRLELRGAQCYIRYGDGEFSSILGREGPNADGQEHLPSSLGFALHSTLTEIADNPNPMVFVGADWQRPQETWGYLVRNSFEDRIPWAAIQPFVLGIESMDTMNFLEKLVNSPGRNFLVANMYVGTLAERLRAIHINVALPKKKVEELMLGPEALPSPNTPGYYGHDSAYYDMPKIRNRLLGELRPGDKVIWCAGLGSKPSLYKTFRRRAGTSHFDMGCFFDGAVGLVSRSWLDGRPPDSRLTCYHEKYVPWLLGKS